MPSLGNDFTLSHGRLTFKMEDAVVYAYHVDYLVAVEIDPATRMVTSGSML
jgi:hypothetical protein